MLVHGSYSRGTQGHFSDVDLRVITAADPRVRDRVYLEPVDGRLVHVSIGSRSLAELHGLASDPRKWQYVRPQYESATLLWEEPGTLARLRAFVASREPGALPYVDGLQLALETVLEYATKVRHARDAGDFAQAAFFARRVAEYAWETVHACSGPRTLPSETDWLADYLELGDIRGYRQNALICHGLTPGSRSLDDVFAASLHLSDAVVAWVGERLPALGGAAGGAVSELISSGKAAAYLRQLRP